MSDGDISVTEIAVESPPPSDPARASNSNSFPAPAKVQLHELSSENAVLRARLRSTTQELKNTRDLCQRLTMQANRGGPRSRSARSDDATSRDTAVQTKELKGLRPLSTAFRSAAAMATSASLTAHTVGVQTTVGGKDCIVVPATGGESQLAAAVSGSMNDEVRRLKAEVLRSHAECASLHHAIQIMKSGSPLRNHAGPGSPTSQAMFPDDHGCVPEYATGGAAADAQSVAKASHLAAMERIATLTEALKQANDSIADLEREVAQRRTAALEAPSAGSEVLLRDSATTVKLNKATITDDAQLDVRLPASTDSHVADNVPSRVNKSSALEQALSITRAQLNEALEELSTSRSGKHGVVAAPKNSLSVGVTADLHQPLAEVFKAHEIDMTVEAVEELVAVKTRHLDLVRHTRDLEAKALSSTNSSAIRELSNDLENARKELTAAHQHIDELNYALDLEKRERFNPQNLLQRYAATDASPERERIVVADEAQKQAAAEISFLCDTLAATKADAESLRTQLEQAALERDSAVHSFRELKAKTEAVLQGCQEITEATRADADQAISTLTHTVHSKDSEIFSLRGQTAALQRDLEKTSKSLSASQKEADAMKQRVATVQSAMSKLREDSSAQTAQLREVRAQLAAHHASALSSPRASTAGGPTPRGPYVRKGSSAMSPGQERRHADASANLSSIQALQQALDEREVDSSATRRLGDFGSPTQTVSRSRSASPQSAARRRPRVAAADSGPIGDGLSYDELKAEYEELRACFLVLASMAPNAVTAREVTDALTAAFDAQKDRCAAVERELRKRTTTLQALKKELTAAREQIAELEKKTTQASALEQRIATLNRQLDKQKRAAVQHAAEHAEAIERANTRMQDLESELEETRAALGLARSELREGRELMLSLIGEDQEALAVINAESASAAGSAKSQRSKAGAGAEGAE